MEPKNPIETKVWDSVLKMVEIMPKLELFEQLVNGEVVAKVKTQKKKDPEYTEPDEVGETTIITFEERSKLIKERLNGKTYNSAETN